MKRQTCAQKNCDQRGHVHSNVVVPRVQQPRAIAHLISTAQEEKLASLRRRYLWEVSVGEQSQVTIKRRKLQLLVFAVESFTINIPTQNR